MRRLEALDGLRGYFLVFMMLNHLVFTGGYLLVKVNHGELGFVQDAQGFVFLSGLLVGMVYAGQMKKRGYAAGAAKIRHRARELYGWELFCLAAIMALGAVLSQSAVFWEPWLWQLAKNDWHFALATATLLYQPTYMDILPQYIVYMLAAPPLVWLCVTGRWHLVAVGSFLLWMMVQFGAHLPLADAVDGAMKRVDPELALRAHFNVFAWQVVFMSGLVLGALTTTRQIDWGKVMDPAKTALLWCAVGILVFFLAWRLGRTFEILPQSIVERISATEIRGEFSLLFVLNFAGLAYTVAWLMIAGVRSEHVVPRRIGEGLHALFNLSFLRLLGRHSLQVYVFHVIVVYLLKGFDHHFGPFNEATKTAIALLAIASMAIPALWREARAARATATPAGRLA
ncbi:OpgC family protein [Chthonobacter rhizosphaerae]|uniref:OpgC family protein n=1 Tax=Chthonobacter rhizosphaerae TaxID=2735553 RepID=UPI0015EF10D0|nr:OpgC domain-containing protein [Chthonobacter rhizosphaerae]